jgi:hypothetical protein
MQAVRVSRFVLMAVLAMVVLGGMTATGSNAQTLDHNTHTTKVFTGVKVNVGTVTHTKVDGKNVLTLSDDFVVPGTRDPHWQVVDSQGNAYLLDRLQAKNGKYNKSIVVPVYVPNIVKVQIWCAFAEAVLGETAFESPVM